jgi:hypothetical protein
MMKEEVARVSLYSNTMMIVTSVHHAYGAVVYDTPWRLHILMMSIPVIIFTVVVNQFLMKREYRWKKLSLWFFGAIILIFSCLSIGGFEGVYNHALKDILFFSGTDKTLLDKLFPPPAYVMPNDFLFEATGVMQAAIFVPLGIKLLELLWKLKTNYFAPN